VKLGAGSRLAFLLISAYSSEADYAIRGLAADHTRLFVSNAFDNRVQVFDAQTMQALGAFPVREPGRIALASDGSLWIIEHSRTDRAQRVVHHARNGARLGELTLPEGVVPVDLSVDTRGRLLVADNGVRQQVLIFSADSGTAAGVTAGVTAGGTEGMTAGMTASREANAAGSTQQAAAMKLTSSFGQEGGIYAGRAGAPGPRRFNGLTGVA
jgi:hypothetical protein